MKKNWKRNLIAAGLAAVLGLGIVSLPEDVSDGTQDPVNLDTIPEYAGIPYTELNGGVPSFTEELLASAAESFESYSPLDELDRPGTALASVGADLMPEGERESIGMIRPAGFSTVRYDDLIEDKYLYNRCHLIGWQLTGQNANPENLITGTRYMNVEGMLPFENQIASYIRRTGNQVLYRVTPLYDGDELLCRGIQMEARSVVPGGAVSADADASSENSAGLADTDASSEVLEFNVFVYNVQPGIEIDYATGESWRAENAESSGSASDSSGSDSSGSAGNNSGSDSSGSAGDGSAADLTAAEDASYILNRNSHKFHLPDCQSVSDMKEKNKIYSSEDRQTILEQGYDPCKRCNPYGCAQ